MPYRDRIAVTTCWVKGGAVMASVSLVAMKRLNRQRFPGEGANRAAFVRATLEKREATFMGRSRCQSSPLVGSSHGF